MDPALRLVPGGRYGDVFKINAVFPHNNLEVSLRRFKKPVGLPHYNARCNRAKDSAHYNPVRVTPLAVSPTDPARTKLRATIRIPKLNCTHYTLH